MRVADFKISPAVIWCSSIILGVLSSVPQLAQHSFNITEGVVNAVLTAAFAIVMWYVNLYVFAWYKKKSPQKQISTRRLFITFGIGIVIMFGLAWLQQLILAHINFGPVMLMIEVRGLLINLICYTVLHLLQQNYENRHMNIELQQVKNDNLAAQYELLKQQVNPHFLFNSLNTLKSMVEIGEKEAVAFIIKLSNFYRYTLDSRKLDLIKISEEMEIVESFLYLQKARFGRAFIFEHHLSLDILVTFIPPFALQLLIENCLKHNVISEEYPLHICLYHQDNQLVLENPIRLKAGESHSLGVGLENIRLRYRHLTEKPVEITEDDNIFKIKLPIINENPHY